MTDPAALWVYLAASPLTWLTVTMTAWIAADAVAARAHRHPLVNPVILAIAVVAVVLLVTGTPYPRYFEGAQFVHFMLGPATVAIAVPLVRNLARVRADILAFSAALLAGSVTGIVSAVAVGRAFGLPEAMLISVSPKSVTAAVAMALAEGQGGIPALAAVVVITTGAFGAVILTPLLDRLGIEDHAARGTAAGLAAHGIGTAQAFSVGPLDGTFAGVAMGLNALLTSVLLPILLPWLLP